MYVPYVLAFIRFYKEALRYSKRGAVFHAGVVLPVQLPGNQGLKQFLYNVGFASDFCQTMIFSILYPNCYHAIS